MGQQPNIELELSDRPRTKPGPGIARGWRPNRPGDLVRPSDVPSGGKFGIIGPDAGYAMKLVGERTLKLLPGEHHHDAAAAVAALAAARAATRGRAPSAEDVSVAMIILGFEPSATADPKLRTARPGWLANVGHDDAKLRQIVADVPGDVLDLTPTELVARASAGWAFRA